MWTSLLLLRRGDPARMCRAGGRPDRCGTPIHDHSATHVRAASGSWSGHDAAEWPPAFVGSFASGRTDLAASNADLLAGADAGPASGVDLLHTLRPCRMLGLGDRRRGRRASPQARTVPLTVVATGEGWIPSSSVTVLVPLTGDDRDERPSSVMVDLTRAPGS
ncbi:hypothetical protein GCM10009836_48590 [Pseudonocardia ailaonensis]|uniref:Uncharacterized protein n=1 Tax=Pseudonocardia ailaonensis TaxID=367279 RepID=A0ABN2NC41_9PSEU